MRTGVVAQLGERLNGIQEVRGSIPLGSTYLNRIFWLCIPNTIPHNTYQKRAVRSPTDLVGPTHADPIFMPNL